MVKEQSNATWKCGDTPSTNKLSTKAAVLVYIGDITKYVPGVFFYFHLSNGWLSAKLLDNVYTGHKSGCQYLGLEYTLDSVNICVDV